MYLYFHNRLYKSRFIYFLLLLIVPLLAIKAEADKFKYCGIQFLPDRLELADDGSYLVQIWDKESLVAQSELGPWLLNLLAENQSRIDQVESIELADYLESCPKQNQEQTEVLLLTKLLERKDLEFFNWSKFFDRGPKAAEVIKTALKARPWHELIALNKSQHQHKLIVSAVFALYLRDPEWLKSEQPRLFYFLQPSLESYAYNLLSEYIAANDLSSLRALQGYLNSITDFNDFRIALQVAIELFELKNKLNSESNSPHYSTECSALYNLSSASKQIKDAVYPFYRQIILEILGKLTSSNNLNPASLQNVSDCLQKIDAERSSPQTILIIAEVLNKLNQQSLLPGLSTAAKARLLLLLESESELKQKYSGILAEAEVSKVSEQSGIKSTTIRMAVLMVVFVVLGLIFYLLFRKMGLSSFIALFASPEKQIEEIKEFTEDGEPASSRRSFVRVDNSRAQNKEVHEYAQKLKLFSLGVEASLKDIKSAYRHSVKSCHPDLNPNQTELEKKEFLDLSTAYERIIELRKQLNLD